MGLCLCYQREVKEEMKVKIGFVLDWEMRAVLHSRGLFLGHRRELILFRI